MKSNFSWKMTSKDWDNIVEHFVATAPDRWFTWVEWFLVVAALKFLAKNTDSIAIELVSFISYFLLFLHFQFKLINVIQNINKKISGKFRVFIAFGLAWLILWVYQFGVETVLADLQLNL